jgi:membrane fusion protein, multidrug efflux system
MVVDLIKDRRQSLLVPEQALAPESNKNYVYVIGPDNVAKRVEIVLGRRRVGAVEVLEGLVEGDLVVTEGIMDLRPGGRVNVINRDKIGAIPASADMGGPARGPS